LLAGCATSRNVARARELTDCREPRLEQLDYQPPSEGLELEPAPELVWYRACASTVVCLAANPPDCFEAPLPVSRAGVVVDRCGEARCLRPRKEYALSGLTHEQTVRRAQLIAERDRLGPAQPPNQSVCGASLDGSAHAWWSHSQTGNGAGAAIILLPFFALVAAVSMGCAIDRDVAAEHFKRAQELDAEIFELDRLRTAP